MVVIDLLFRPKGRIGRTAYWAGIAALAALALLIAATPLNLFATLSGLAMAPTIALATGRVEWLGGGSGPAILATLGMLYAGFCVYGGRLRDVGLPGWLYVVALASQPVFIAILAIPFVVLAAAQGQTDNPTWSQSFAFGVAPLAMPLGWLTLTVVLGLVPSRTGDKRRAPLRPLRLLFSFRGRIGRGGFWGGWIAGLFLLIVAPVLAALARLPPGPALFLPVVAVWFYFGVCLCGKRLHDLGLPAWGYGVFLLALCLLFCGGVIVALIAFGPSGTPTPPGHVAAQRVTLALELLAIAAFALWLGVWPGQREANRYGPPPDSGA